MYIKNVDIKINISDYEILKLYYICSKNMANAIKNIYYGSFFNKGK